MSIYYIYKVTNTITNEFYYGSRTAKVMQHRKPEEDLWIHYFTSSKVVKKQIEQYSKDAFEVEILHTSDDLDMLYWHEQIYIYYHISDPLCLNMHYIDPHSKKDRFSFVGKTPWNKGLKTNRPAWNKGQKLAEKTKSKMRKPKKLKSSAVTRKGVLRSQETKDKIAASKRGKHHSEATKEKLRAARLRQLALITTK